MSTLQIEERITVSAPPKRVWKFLLDPARVAACLPGAKLDGTEGDDTFLGTMKVKVGPVLMEIKGKATMSDIDPVERRVTLTGTGNDKAGGGSARMDMKSQILEKEGGSEIVVMAEVHLAGKLVRFGRGMMEGISKQLFKQFAERVHAALDEVDEEEEEEKGETGAKAEEGVSAGESAPAATAAREEASAAAPEAQEKEKAAVEGKAAEERAAAEGAAVQEKAPSAETAGPEKAAGEEKAAPEKLAGEEKAAATEKPVSEEKAAATEKPVSEEKAAATEKPASEEKAAEEKAPVEEAAAAKAPAEKKAATEKAPAEKGAASKKKSTKKAIVPVEDNAPLDAGSLVWAAIWAWIKGLFARIFGRKS